MKALILVGGLGTRLRPLTVNTPKAMMPVTNEPFMAHVVRHLAEHGVSEIILTRGHLASRMEEYFDHCGTYGVSITYVDEPRPLGTAGAIKNCESWLKDSAFFVLNGDIYSDIDFSAMRSYHRQKHALATIALTQVDNPSAFGLVETGDEGEILRFIEKPEPSQITTRMINAGCYLLEPEVLNHIELDTVVSIERETFQHLLQKKLPFYGFDITGNYWMDMGSREKYFQLNMDVLERYKNFEKTVGKDVTIDPSAAITGRVIIGDRCCVEAGAAINGPTIIGNDCRIAADACISNSVIWSGVHIGACSNVKESIVADNCVIGPDSLLQQAALADGIYTTSGISLCHTNVWPGSILDN